MAFWAFVFWVAVQIAVAWTIGELLKKRTKIASAKPGEFNVPDIEEGAEYPVIFGTCRIVPLIAWWGRVNLKPIYNYYTEKRWFHAHRVYYVTGYNYLIGMHFRLTTGYCDVKQIYIGGKLIWPDPANPQQVANDGTTSITINQPAIFGGQSGEGGIVGSADIMHGAATQPINSYLSSVLGNDISAFKGVVSVVLKDMNIGMSPYPKNWSFLCKRTAKLSDGTTQWYPVMADINNDMNPVHIIRECYTNAEWGFGYSESLFDDAIWQKAADDLYGEEFGLSRLYDRTFGSLTDFIKEVLRHIDAVIYQNMSDGKFVIKLIRKDYDENELEVFDENEIVSIEDFYRPSYGNVPTQLDVNYWDYWNDIKATITDSDISVFQKQGKHISGSVDYYGVTNSELASMLVSRDHRQMTSMLASFKIRSNRMMSHLKPGDVIKASFHGISNMITRISGVKYGELTNGILTFDCMEDVFAAQEALSVVPPTGWTPTYIQPQPPPDQLLVEAPFYVLYTGGDYESVIGLDQDAGFLLLLVAFAWSSNDFRLKLRRHTDQEFEDQGIKSYAFSAILDTDMPVNADEIQVDTTNFNGSDDWYFKFGIKWSVGELAIIGDEVVSLVALDFDTKKMTFKRGVLDTVPEAHNKGEYIYFPGVTAALIEEELVADNQPGVKIMPNTIHGTLPEGDAAIINGPIFGSRQIRPYPPGRFRINDQSYPQIFTGQPTISWKHRDRLVQLARIIQHDEDNIGPEAGTTYTLKIYDEDNDLIRTESGLTGTSFEYTVEMEKDDCEFGEDRLNWQLRFELLSVRNGYNSWQSYNLNVLRGPRTFGAGVFGEYRFGDW